MDEINAATGYVDGYNCGYEWLGKSRAQYPRGFKHPSEPGGYKPGGPSNFQYKWLNDNGKPSAYAGFTKVINPAWQAQQEYNAAWHKGWRDGINNYVRDNGLSFPEVE